MTTFQMSDEEFQNLFDNLSYKEMLIFFGDNFKSVTMRNGINYHIENLDDLIAVVEQELYTKLTGRE